MKSSATNQQSATSAQAHAQRAEAAQPPAPESETNSQKRFDFYNKMFNGPFPFPSNLEILVNMIGYKSEIVNDLTIMLATLDFVQKEYGGDISTLYNKSQIKGKALAKFVEFINKQHKADRTYRLMKQREVLDILELDQLEPDEIPLSIQPLTVIDRRVPSVTRIAEFEKEIKTEEDKERFAEMKRGVDAKEDELRTRVGPEAYEKFIKPDPRHSQELALCLYHSNMAQWRACCQTGMASTNLEVEVLSGFSPLCPRESLPSLRYDTAVIKSLCKLMPREQRTEFLQLLKLENESDLEKLMDANSSDVVKRLGGIADLLNDIDAEGADDMNAVDE